jgi:hypothetical protein
VLAAFLSAAARVLPGGDGVVVSCAVDAAAAAVAGESVVSRMGMVPTGHAPNSKANR